MPSISRILLVANPDVDNTAAIRRAAAAARQHGASVTLAGLIDSPELLEGQLPASLSAREVSDTLARKCSDWLGTLRDNGPLKDIDCRLEVIAGRAFIEIIRTVAADSCDLVVKAADRRPGPSSFSSTDMHLMRKCPCPVWVIKQSLQRQFGVIVAALDRDQTMDSVSTLNLQILGYASALANAESSDLHIVHAWHLRHSATLESGHFGIDSRAMESATTAGAAEARAWLEATVARYRREHVDTSAGTFEPTIHVRVGDPRREVPGIARDLGAGLVVMGSVTRTDIRGMFMGITAEDILNQVESSVLTLKPPDFESPISLS